MTASTPEANFASAGDMRSGMAVASVDEPRSEEGALPPAAASGMAVAEESRLVIGQRKRASEVCEAIETHFCICSPCCLFYSRGAGAGLARKIRATASVGAAQIL